MRGVYLVYYTEGSDRPLAAFEDIEDAQRFARHVKWSSHGVWDAVFEPVPYFKSEWSAPTWEVAEATEADLAAADPLDELFDPRDDGEVCDGC